MRNEEKEGWYFFEGLGVSDTQKSRIVIKKVDKKQNNLYI